MRIRDVEVLTLREGRMTTGRRNSPVSQLKCVGGSAGCSVFVPQVVQCYNRGWDGYDAQVRLFLVVFFCGPLITTLNALYFAIFFTYGSYCFCLSSILLFCKKISSKYDSKRHYRVVRYEKFSVWV